MSCEEFLRENKDGALLGMVLWMLVMSPATVLPQAAPEAPADAAGAGGKAPLIPALITEVDSWLAAALKQTTPDPKLTAAEAAPVKVIKVSKNGGEFNSIQKALDSIPEGNTKRVIISIAPGKYEEKVIINRTKPFITLKGESHKEPSIISWHDTAKTHGTVDSASAILESEYFMGINLGFENTAPKPDGKMVGAQAVACRVSGDKAAFYNCKFIGFQDTLCDDKGNHFFMDCHIEGTVDFIFGSGTSIFLRTEIFVIANEQGMSVITAQAREGEDKTGYSFVHCKVTGTTTGSFLGRAWKTAPKVIYAYTDMGDVLSDAAWSNDNHPDRDKSVFYGEYKCFGPGADPSGRYPPTKALTEADVAPFLSLDFINGTNWLLPPAAPAAPAA